MKFKPPARKLKSPEWDVKQLAWSRAARIQKISRPSTPLGRFLLVLHIIMFLAGIIANIKEITAALGH
jgi:hypothetical protein